MKKINYILGAFAAVALKNSTASTKKDFRC